jgi:hypothetical protein
MSRTVTITMESGDRIHVVHDGELDEVAVSITNRSGTISTANIRRSEARILAAAIEPMGVS